MAVSSESDTRLDNRETQVILREQFLHLHEAIMCCKDVAGLPPLVAVQLLVLRDLQHYEGVTNAEFEEQHNPDCPLRQRVESATAQA